ncbi:MAG: tRNA 2-thiouridine(34) synthase MnmA [Gammaproteobacteria bacterium]|nr:tRNA 2-thiouridine(34) synthase MnmA [Gammaproteobacteria bacterium]
MSRAKVIVGLSGGVDSAVAALLLKEQGYRVEGLFMKNWEEDDSAEYCAAAEDLNDARAVADCLDIPLHSINFSGEYWDRVFEYFLAEYRLGRTPNPDVLCNREIKFKAFLDHALDRGASLIATGHYARVTKTDNQAAMLRAFDENKDQTYFLYMLGQYQLQYSLFPLGELQKQTVRELATEAGFPNHKKKDSTGICFIGERKFTDFLSQYIPANPGPMKTPAGEEIGQHQGLMYYTLGQRKGLGIGGRNNADDEPWFAVEKDIPNNTLIVAQGHNHPLLMKQGLTASQLHWVSGQAPSLPLRCEARFRHRQPLQWCTLSSDHSEMIRLEFEQPQRAVTPGQSVVFYDQQRCLGGGIIEHSF